MNDTELENLLRSMTPVAPSPELAGRVQHDLDLVQSFREATPEAALVKKKPAQWLANIVWAGLGAAAAVVAMGAVQSQGRTNSGLVSVASISPAATAVPAAAVMPVSSTREWVDVEDMGISFATPGSPSRQMKVISVERHQWIDPRDGAEYTVEVPKQESLALPVKYQ
ncbi:MAG: hypothetical protein JWO89_2520 [Verrucomicrobiaceae bacterium]|nr:hypothetical protein [Verrucomicrobiaceae bacterium]